MALKLEQLERFRCLEPGDEEGLWEALETLLHCLDDHLVVVDETRFEEGSLCRLTAFTAHKDSRHTPLYAAVTDTGVGVVGRTDKLSTYQTQGLADFDPLWHEIVSLAVSDRYRFVGDRLDLWIVARRFRKGQHQEPKIIAYHGLVWQGQDAEPRLQPAWDDSDLSKTITFRAQPADRLPEWLRNWNFSCAPGIDPFTELPRRTDYLLGQHPMEIVTRAAKTLCYSTGDRILVIHPEVAPINRSNPSHSISLIEQASALTLTNDSPGNVHGVAGCDDLKLVAFSET